jgi:hypothetical protein
MSAERRKELKANANRAYLRAKLIEAHEYAARAKGTDPQGRRCMVIGWLLGASRMDDPEIDRLTRLLQDGAE